MKKLIVYYSLTGNTKFVAEVLSKDLGADLAELKPKNEFKKLGFLTILKLAFSALTRSRAELLPLDKSLLDYDLIVIGTPVWAGRPSPAMNAFIAGENLVGKKVAVFCACGSSGRKTFDILKKELSQSEIISEHEFVDPLKDKLASEKEARSWVKEILTKLEITSKFSY